jgi:hypothetical protein
MSAALEISTRRMDEDVARLTYDVIRGVLLLDDEKELSRLLDSFILGGNVAIRIMTDEREVIDAPKCMVLILSKYLLSRQITHPTEICRLFNRILGSKKLHDVKAEALEILERSGPMFENYLKGRYDYTCCVANVDGVFDRLPTSIQRFIEGKRIRGVSRCHA